jgi:polyhydroxybutyrate depolymerase
MKLINYFCFLAFIFETYTADAQYLTFSHGGLNRQYLYYAPPGLPANSPLIVVMHGYSDDATAIQNYSGMNLIADAYGFAVCYPRGTVDHTGYRFFNVGYDFNVGIDTVNDLDFLEDLAVYLQQSQGLDSNRTYATGLSNGGDMCYKIACEGSGVFKAVAPVAGMALQNILSNNTNYSPIPICEFHGTADNVTYFTGDPNNMGGWGAYPSLPSTINYFSGLNSCNQTTTDTLADTDPSDGSFIIREKHSINGSNCNQVWMYKVVGGGHDWIGSWGNMDVYAGVEMVEFFQDVYCNSLTNIDPQISNNKSLNVYPNPANSQINVKADATLFGSVYTVYDNAGKSVFSGKINSENTVIELGNLSGGIYLLSVGDNLKQTLKIIKE